MAATGVSTFARETANRRSAFQLARLARQGCLSVVGLDCDLREPDDLPQVACDPIGEVIIKPIADCLAGSIPVYDNQSKAQRALHRASQRSWLNRDGTD